MINNRPENGPARSSGVALVLVLAFLVLITVFVIAFFSSVTTERATSKDYANQVSTKQLADSAVNLVMAQIVDATTGTNSVSRLAWASQPGMIRTYDVTGADAGFYKLYSSKNMITHQAQLATDLAADVPSNWYSMPAFYTDLNSPILVSDTGGGIVPNSSAPGDKYTAVYPILNPLAQAPNPDLPSTGQAEGFSISGTSVGYTGANPPVANYNPTPVTGAANTPNPAAMPTQWLYVLQDGSVTAPDGTGANGTIATWSGSTSVAPTTLNPIVGRIAFWTDDETSKININTAGGDQQNRAGVGAPAFVGQPATSPGGSDSPGSFWDIPRTESAEDQSLAECQLVQGEYQRYPGHPSTVALSTLFPSLTRDQIIALTPRLSSTNSSEGGTVFTSTNSVSTPAPMTFGLNRLYASTDELFFQPGTTSGYRLANTTGTTSASNSIMDQYRFFLTAHSRAPETNLFNLPRVTIWPITTQTAAQTASTTYQTASDSLISFCSTTGTNPFYFTRYDPTSMTNDYAAIPRNQALYSYLQWLTGQKIPGVANSVLGTTCPSNGFSDKYTAPERDQILTEIFDYIRSEINLQDPEVIASGGTPYTPLAAVSGTAGNMLLGSGQVVPIRIVTASGTTQGFGRFPTIAEAAIVWISTTPFSKTTPNPGPFSMQPILLFETYNVSQGFAVYRPTLQHVVKVTQPFSVTVGGTSTNLDFATTGTNQISGIAGDYSESWGGVEGIASPLFSSIVYPPPVKGASGGYGTVKTIPTTRTTQSDNPVTAYPFYSSQIPLLSSTTFDFNGGECTLAIQTMKGETVQTIDLHFPPSYGIPAPQPVPYTNAATGTTGNVSSAYASACTWQLRFNGVSTVGGGAANSLLLTSTYQPDQPTTIRALEPAGQKAKGDYRIIAATPNVTGTTYFVPHLLYSTGTDQFADSLRFAYQGEPYPSSTYGNLVTSTTYNSNTPMSTPDFPSSVTSGAVINIGAGTIPGDWDNGIADMCDGAYINKADEGSVLNGQSTMVNGNENTTYFANGEYNNSPYYAGGELLTTTFHSPNRQVASGVMFGSLSTGVIRGLPWQTLLFHPDPTGVSQSHPGSAQPKDYYLLDLFNMPVVEPYAISEPFSTAGKINLNYQIIPFTYITRTTAVRAVLDSTLTMAIPNTSGKLYKTQGEGIIATNIPKMHYRHPIDPDATLVQWDNRFKQYDIFHSATEVCDQELVPKADGLLITGSLTAAGMPVFWAKNQITGDNTRDMPYNHIYPLLTTKSNTYTVHFRVQSLQKPASDHTPAQWTEGTDKITGEYRGSTMIERYIDANDPNLPDFATNQTETMDAYYKFRVISTKRFEP